MLSAGGGRLGTEAQRRRRRQPPRSSGKPSCVRALASCTSHRWESAPACCVLGAPVLGPRSDDHWAAQPSLAPGGSPSEAAAAALTAAGRPPYQNSPATGEGRRRRRSITTATNSLKVPHIEAARLSAREAMAPSPAEGSPRPYHIPRDLSNGEALPSPEYMEGLERNGSHCPSPSRTRGKAAWRPSRARQGRGRAFELLARDGRTTRAQGRGGRGGGSRRGEGG